MAAPGEVVKALLIASVVGFLLVLKVNPRAQRIVVQTLTSQFPYIVILLLGGLAIMGLVVGSLLSTLLILVLLGASVALVLHSKA